MGTIPITFANIAVGTSVHRWSAPKTIPSTVNPNTVETTDTMAYRNIFLPLAVL